MKLHWNYSEILSSGDIYTTIQMKESFVLDDPPQQFKNRVYH